MQYLDEVKLCFGHSLVIGNAPAKLTMEQISKATSKQVVQEFEKFGLFETSSPNYTNYYPEVTAEDLVPKESDFIEPIFRALSEVIVHKGSNPIDFGMNGVLKASMKKLYGQTINVDHETATGNAMGAVSDVFWEESYKAGAITVPAGIQAKMKIDGKSNPRIARAIMMEPPAIHSASVTVSFLWEKSHSNLNEQEFFSKLGSFDKDGMMYRRIASLVKNYREISLVGHGADPFAQKTGPDGKIVNPKYANQVYNTARERADAMREVVKDNKYFFFDYREDIISNSEEHTIPLEFKEDETSNTDIMLKELALALGLKETATQAEVLAALTANKTAADGIAALNTQITALTGEITTLKAGNPSAADVAELKVLRDTATASLAARRATVLAAYNKTTKKPLETVTNTIAAANLETLQVLEDTYKADIERLMPAKCGDCGSTKINRASSIVINEEEDIEENTETVRERILRKKRANNLGVSSIPIVADKK